jgi:hypothetical protein
VIEIEIPGFQVLQLSHLVLDYNGTLAVNGFLHWSCSGIPGGSWRPCGRKGNPPRRYGGLAFFNPPLLETFKR